MASHRTICPPSPSRPACSLYSRFWPAMYRRAGSPRSIRMRPYAANEPPGNSFYAAEFGGPGRFLGVWAAGIGEPHAPADDATSRSAGARDLGSASMNSSRMLDTRALTYTLVGHAEVRFH